MDQICCGPRLDFGSFSSAVAPSTCEVSTGPSSSNAEVIGPSSSGANAGLEPPASENCVEACPVEQVAMSEHIEVSCDCNH